MARSRPGTGTRRIDEPNDFVRLEIESSLKSADVRVIPVLVEGAQMPQRDEPRRVFSGSRGCMPSSCQIPDGPTISSASASNCVSSVPPGLAARNLGPRSTIRRGSCGRPRSRDRPPSRRPGVDRRSEQRQTRLLARLTANGGRRRDWVACCGGRGRSRRLARRCQPFLAGCCLESGLSACSR